MTRAQAIEKAARWVLQTMTSLGLCQVQELEGSLIAHGPAVKELERALALPPEEPRHAPSMEEIERLVTCLDAAVTTASHGEWTRAKEAEVDAAYEDLLAAIRALPDRYEEGWQAALAAFADRMMAKANAADLAATFQGGPLHGASVFNVYEKAAREARSLPTPNPEDRHG